MSRTEHKYDSRVRAAGCSHRQQRAAGSAERTVKVVNAAPVVALIVPEVDSVGQLADNEHRI